MYWLTLVSGALALSITGPKAAIRKTGDKVELEYTAFEAPLEIGPDQTLDIRFGFSGEDSLEQVFVSVKGSGIRTKTFPAKVRKNTVRASLPFEGFQEGECEVRAYVAGSGETDISEPLKVTAKAVKAEKPGQFDPKKKFSEENQIDYEPKPEILHQFSPPPRMVSAPVAIVFASAVWVLFLGLVATWKSQVGLEFGATPFVGSLAAIEAVFLSYYYRLSIFTTLFFTAAIGAVAAVAGLKALKTLPDVEATREETEPASSEPKAAKPKGKAARKSVK